MVKELVLPLLCRPTTACTRLPNSRFSRGQAAATMPVVGVGLVGSVAGEAERWASQETLLYGDDDGFLEGH